MQQWYYHDAARGRVGPMEASQLRDAWQRREVQADTLVWREGLAEWQPLGRMSSELGLDGVAPDTRQPPPLPAAAAPPPISARPAHAAQAPRKGLSGCVIVLIVLGVVSIPVLGILAAIALPAYQDYTLRSKVVVGMAQATTLKVAISEFSQVEGRCPENGDPGFGDVDSYAGDSVRKISIGSLRKSTCAFEVTFDGIGDRLDGETMRFEGTVEEGGEILDWDCSGGTLPRKYRPSSCRAD